MGTKKSYIHICNGHPLKHQRQTFLCAAYYCCQGNHSNWRSGENCDKEAICQTSLRCRAEAERRSGDALHSPVQGALLGHECLHLQLPLVPATPWERRLVHVNSENCASRVKTQQAVVEGGAERQARHHESSPSKDWVCLQDASTVHHSFLLLWLGSYARVGWTRMGSAEKWRMA